MNLTLFDLVKALIVVLGVGIAIFLGIEISTASYALVAVFFAAFLAFPLLLSNANGASLLILAVGMLDAQSAILPFSMGPFHVVMLATIPVAFILVMLGRIRFSHGNPVVATGAAGASLIVFYHVKTSGLGSIAMGSSAEGGAHTYMTFFLDVAAYFVVSTLPLSSRFERRLGWFAMVGPCVSAFVDTVGFVAPKLLPYVALLYMGFNGENFDAYRRGTELIRIGGLRDLGVAIALVTCSYSRMKGLWHPSKWSVPVLLAIGFACMLLGGFRGYIVIFMAIILVYCFIDSLPMFLIATLLIGATVATLAFGQGHLFHLPVTMQRALTFLPGDWDYNAQYEASMSTLWRLDLWKYFYTEKWPHLPWYGTGFGYDRFFTTMNEVTYYNDWNAITRFAEMRGWHSGILFVLDTTGFVGLACWLLILGGIFRDVMRGFRRMRTGTRNAAIRYFTVFTLFLIGLDVFNGGFDIYFTVLMVHAAFLHKVLKREETEAIQAEPVAPEPAAA